MSEKNKKSSLRQKADEIKEFRCKDLIAVIENPFDYHNIGSVIRNANALGVDKVYIVDQAKSLPNDWEEMRDKKALKKNSVGAVKWTFVKRFDTTESCLTHLEKKGFKSIVTSPYQKGKDNVLLDEGDFTKAKKLAVWFGNESKGISDLAVEKSDICLSVPMYGIIESFNLGTTSGIVLYEIAKQRRAFMQKMS